MRSEVKKMMEADVQGHRLNNVSGSEQEDALAQKTENHQQQQTEIKDEIKAVHRHHNEGAREFQVGVSCQSETGAGVISLQWWNSRKLEEKAEENQTEDEVESHVDEAMESQGNIKQSSSRKTWPRMN